MKDPWGDLAYWESEYQAHAGVMALCRRPYFTVADRSNQEPDYWYPTAMLYPDAPTVDEEEAISEAARYITAVMRGAHEFTVAASHVAETVRPVLQFYATELLARAVAVAVLGPLEVAKQKGHGVSVGPAGLDSSMPWLITWQRYGDFVGFYRAVRWDAIYGGPSHPGPYPSFHVLECLRRLGLVEWPDSVSWPDTSDPRAQLIRAWSRDNAATHYLTPDSLRHEPLFELPDVLVEFMVVYYLSILARYHPVVWQELLAGKMAEGYHLRRAVNEVFARFLRHVADLLPRPESAQLFRPAEWAKTLPTYQDIQLRMSLVGLPRKPFILGTYPPPVPWHRPDTLDMRSGE